MLGGFGFVSEADIAESSKFLSKVFSAQLKEGTAGTRRLIAAGELREHRTASAYTQGLSKSTHWCVETADCGAGVGRVSEQLLLHHFHEVDLVEPSRHLLDTAEQRMSGPKASTSFPADHKLGNTFCMGLQQYDPQPER